MTVKKPQWQSYWCASALLEDGWAENVVLHIDAGGLIVGVHTDVEPAALDCEVEKLAGVVLPGMVNLHSHAHQRAMAGLGEKASSTKDSFWTWRQAMYRCLEQITPDQLYDIARMLYLEMLQGGYTRVAEFQYLHHDLLGKAYANRAEMTLQCLQAARDVGIGFTALPVLYQYGGFGAEVTTEGQRRFLNNGEEFLEIFEALQSASNGQERVGIAPHSLRAVSDVLLRQVLDGVSDESMVHIHIAEQVAEVEQCLAWSGQRPVGWLVENFAVDERWCLIHATHMTEKETALVAQSGAVVGLCPTTEANLGDGFFNAEQYFAAGGVWGIGSDSQISVSVVEELRWLEYGQRLRLQRRNVLAGESLHTGRNLYSESCLGGAQAAGIDTGVLAVGKSADFILLDDRHSRLVGRSENSLLDSWIFSGNDNVVSGVFVAGRQVVSEDGHVDVEEIQKKFCRVIDELS